ncbi:hypothetical protein MHBO_004201 [Bonamia ostreae]|uniref:Uncharacterized protein n=1 Tax=Bonamia ostreae TaxID=126728 RepID=A0ABV2AT73_9EUKA
MEQLRVTFLAGYSAGIICALVSHPADSLVSLMGKSSFKGKGFVAIAKNVGFRKLMFNGLMVRILMIGTLTGFQWWIYDSFKTALGLGTSGGGAAQSKNRK